MNNRHSIWTQIAASTLGSLIFSILSTLLLWMLKKSQLTSPIDVIFKEFSIPIWCILLLVFILSWVILFLLLTRKKNTRFGRWNTMSVNLNILKSRHDFKTENSKIYSTRLTHWPLQEANMDRSNFRAELDQAIMTEKREVKRIWNIGNKEDAQRLMEILSKYQNYNNISIRYFTNLPVYTLPELLVVNSDIASTSYPQKRNPFEIEACEVYRNDKSIRILENYFEIMWDNATKLLENGNITNIDKLKNLNTISYWNNHFRQGSIEIHE